MKKKTTKKRKPKESGKRQEIRCFGILKTDGKLAEHVFFDPEDCKWHLERGELIVELVARMVRR